MLNKKRNGSDQIVLAAIETIEEVDFLLMTELTAWFVLSVVIWKLCETVRIF